MPLVPDSIEKINDLEIYNFNLLKHNENNIKNPTMPRKATKSITIHRLVDILIPMGTTMAEGYVRATYYNKMQNIRYNYILDENSIWCCLPKSWQNWSCKDSNDKYNSGNLFSVSIGVVGDFTKIKEKLIKLISYLLSEYSLLSKDVKRHNLNNDSLCRVFNDNDWNELINIIKIRNKEVEENKKIETIPVINEKKKSHKDYEIIASVYVDNEWHTFEGKNEIIVEKDNRPISAFALLIENFPYSYRVHLYNGGWSKWITQYNLKDWLKGLGGLRKGYIDGLQISTNLKDCKIKYRVMPAGKDKFLSWIENSTDFTISYYPINKIQIKIEG